MSSTTSRAATASADSSRKGPPGASSARSDSISASSVASSPHACARNAPDRRRRATPPDGRAARSGSSVQRSSAGFRSSRRSHDFASRQSRWTVSGEMSSAAAVSSTLNPPKKRNSTTRLFRVSILRAPAGQGRARRDRADARRRPSSRHPAEPGRPLRRVSNSACARDVDQNAPHHPADIAKKCDRSCHLTCATPTTEGRPR